MKPRVWKCPFLFCRDTPWHVEVPGERDVKLYVYWDSAVASALSMADALQWKREWPSPPAVTSPV